MSSYDGGGFEEWVRDSIYGNVSENQMLQVITILEPLRHRINELCDDYDEETQSWREYRNALWDIVPKSLDDQITTILCQTWLVEP